MLFILSLQRVSFGSNPFQFIYGRSDLGRMVKAAAGSRTIRSEFTCLAE